MQDERLFEAPFRFPGLPESGFAAFAIPDRVARREAILAAFHPPLRVLADDLLEHLRPHTALTLHAHLPRLDWPAGYQPFCTWLALSHQTHGYQSGPQLNVGVHADHVAIRLAWDASAPGFGRFEFLCRFAGLGEALAQAAREHGLRVRVYAAAAWPEGSRLVHESESDFDGAFQEVARRGVWFEVGERLDLPGAMAVVTSEKLAERASTVFQALLPHFERLAG
jgi:hypothetical protein